MIRIGSNLRAERHKKKLTLKQVAEMAGISVSYLSQIENDSVNMNMSVLEKISSALGVPPYTFFLHDTLMDISWIRANERDRLQRSDGSVVEYLTDPSLVSTNIHVVILPANYHPEEYSSHPGEEFLHVLEGRMQVEFSNLEVVEVNVGDSLAFSSKIPHKIISEGGCKFIMNSSTLPGIYI